MGMRFSKALLGASILAAGLWGGAAAAEPAEIKVMIFNIWLGGDQVSMAKTLEAIRKADPDVVLLQEAMTNTQMIADRLGYDFASPRQHLLSRFPILESGTPVGQDYSLIEVTPGRFVAVANVHLDWTEYGPYAARDGKTAEEILATENDLRLSGIQPWLDALEPLAAAGLPVVIGGDFNSPSDLDWTEAAVGTRPQVKFPLVWPAAHAVSAAGYSDTWRAIHPDPVANPGVTWSWGYPQPLLWEGETQDRIDLLFARNATVEASEIVGGAMPDVGIVVTPWPSDHQAVVSTLKVEPAPAPTMIAATERAVHPGEALHLRYTVAGTADGRLEDGWVEILAPGGKVGESLQTLYSNDTTDRMAVLEVATFDMAPGAYDAALVDKDGNELARTTFWIEAAGAKPVLATDKASYQAGEPIVVHLENAPGDRFDWLAVFPKGEADEWNYYSSAYTAGVIAGEVTIEGDESLEPGEYEVRLLADDSYRAIAKSASFTVTAK